MSPTRMQKKDFTNNSFSVSKHRISSQCRWQKSLSLIFNVLILVFIVNISITTGGHILSFVLSFFETSEQIKIVPQPMALVQPTQKHSNTANDLNERLRLILKCYDRPYEPEIVQRGEYWVLKNYIRANHGELKCHESLTYTTHADYSFLQNLITVLEHFRAPVSVALHAPGTDFQRTLDAIRYLRDCILESNLVRMYATFHIFFISSHMPKFIPHHSEAVKTPYNCSLPAPYHNVSLKQMYKSKYKVFYPINIGRNIARDAALTHFILPSDIELYPSPGLVESFLKMIARNESHMYRPYPRVYPLPVFEVAEGVVVPRDKAELRKLIQQNLAITFHKYMCPKCHTVPKADEWITEKKTAELDVFHIAKRLGPFVRWEPFYIGTHADPHYDYRLYWDGNHDKMPQAFILCALDYEFHVLNNAFLVHKPGIKKPTAIDDNRKNMSAMTFKRINHVIYPELQILYGKRKGCSVF